jgi:hypothetical protein
MLSPSYLRLRRSQMSAAIEPTTPIAANPANASISGTSTRPALAPTVVAISIPSESQILTEKPPDFYLRLRSHTSAAIEPMTPMAAIPENASISGTGATSA